MHRTVGYYRKKFRARLTEGWRPSLVANYYGVSETVVRSIVAGGCPEGFIADRVQLTPQEVGQRLIERPNEFWRHVIATTFHGDFAAYKACVIANFGEPPTPDPRHPTPSANGHA